MLARLVCEVEKTENSNLKTPLRKLQGRLALSQI